MNLTEKIEQAKITGKLDLRNCNLTKLPASVCDLEQLKSLDLRYNKLTQLPESIGKLSQLLSLNLRWNKITQLPDNIGKLSQLWQKGTLPFYEEY